MELVAWQAANPRHTRVTPACQTRRGADIFGSMSNGGGRSRLLDTPWDIGVDADDSQLPAIGKLPANLNPWDMAMTVRWPEQSLQLFVGSHVRLVLRSKRQHPQ